MISHKNIYTSLSYNSKFNTKFKAIVFPLPSLLTFDIKIEANVHNIVHFCEDSTCDRSRFQSAYVNVICSYFGRYDLCVLQVLLPLTTAYQQPGYFQIWFNFKRRRRSGTFIIINLCVHAPVARHQQSCYCFYIHEEWYRFTEFSAYILLKHLFFYSRHYNLQGISKHPAWHLTIWLHCQDCYGETWCSSANGQWVENMLIHTYTIMLH